MERLPSRQLRALLTFLEGLSAVSDSDAFVSYLFASAPQLIPCEILSYHEAAPSQRISHDWHHPAEIATIIGVRTNTVGKHLERIYQKLGVENRTAAAMRALASIPFR